MTNRSTDSQGHRQRRYTVSRLLELAPQTRTINFDLSKFTYDAARAGVVPPLGACAMSNRRASNDRPHGWSQESSSSQDEVIIYRGNRIVKAPERQPTVPPTEPLAQQDEGFARFLKKHSSPTHQRVTAGGRIVPMEQRPRPPAFSLPPPKQNANIEHKNDTHDGVHANLQLEELDTTGQTNERHEVADNILHPQPQMPVNTGVINTPTITAGINVNLMSTSDAFAMDATSAQPNYLPAVAPAPYYPATYNDPYGLQSPQLFQGGAVHLASPLNGFNAAVGTSFPIPLVPSPEMYGIPASGGQPLSPIDGIPQENAYANHMLAESIAIFEDLDRQLKSLDRHRAMNNLDPCIVEQRKAITQLRANAKSQITYWTERLGFDNKGALKSHPVPPTSVLNVKAAAYVPLRALPSPETLSATTSSALKANGIAAQSEKPSSTSKPARRGIPIVAPPKKSPSPRKDSKGETVSKAGSDDVDEWGVRRGNAPPEIARQQNEMLAMLMRKASKSSHESGDHTVIITPGASSQSISPMEKPVDTHETKDAEVGSESGEWLPTKPGRAPPSVEACYEVQLDAMRLPRGVISKVRMPDGTITEVRGRSLQRPPSFEMDDFERQYWTKKPTVTKEMASTFVEMRACSEDGSPDRMVDYLDFNRLGMESHGTQMKENAKERRSSRDSETSNGHGNTMKGIGKDTTNAQDVGRAVGRKGYSSTAGPPVGSDPSLSILKRSTASSPPVWAAYEPSRNGREVSLDTVNKGYSSVSVQNVHAMGRLPHMLDGTSESQRRSAKSMLSAAGKSISPQPTQGLVAAPEAFYGPFHRQARGITIESDDVFRPRLPQEEDT